MPHFKYILKIRFEWDPNKALLNLAKHGISFEEAIAVFDDPSGRVETDPKHSTPTEKREWRIGESNVGVLVVIFTVRLPGPMYRIISARKADKWERRLYEQNKTV